MPSVLLNESAFVVLVAGGGTAKVGPKSAREIWHPDNVSVNVSFTGTAPVNEAVCVIQVGDANTRRLRDTTFTGSSGDSTDRVNADVIRCGEFVWAVWTGGDTGQTAVVTVTGRKDV